MSFREGMSGVEVVVNLVMTLLPVDGLWKVVIANWFDDMFG